jgi:hypothetical protein
MDNSLELSPGETSKLQYYHMEVREAGLVLELELGLVLELDGFALHEQVMKT